MTPRRAAHIDASQPGIVKALKAAGAGVEVIGYPVDLLVSFGGRWHCLDCKTLHAPRVEKDGYQRQGRVTKRTEDQLEFVKRHSAPVHFVTTGVEALVAVGAWDAMDGE